MTISETLYNEGLDVGYSRIGASKLTSLKTNPIINELLLKHPFAKSIIIAVWHYNFYEIPDHLKDQVCKETLFQGRYLKGVHENDTAIELETFFLKNNLKYVDVFDLNKDIKNQIATEMCIGIIRKNGYFYTEEGSFCNLHAWLVDEAIEWRHDEAPTACLGHCSICIRTCPEKALKKGYVKDHDLCITSNAKPILLHDKIYNIGCDHCQDVCPCNKHRWTYEEKFLNLDY